MVIRSFFLKEGSIYIRFRRWQVEVEIKHVFGDILNFWVWVLYQVGTWQEVHINCPCESDVHKHYL